MKSGGKTRTNERRREAGKGEWKDMRVVEREST